MRQPTQARPPAQTHLRQFFNAAAKVQAALLDCACGVRTRWHFWTRGSTYYCGGCGQPAQFAERPDLTKRRARVATKRRSDFKPLPQPKEL